MNYRKIYNDIISKAAKRKEHSGYYEKHHIVPKSLNGSNDKTNIVKLTSREHFVCHYLLAKVYQPQTFEWYKMNHAFLMMKASPIVLGRYFNSHLYESLRSNFSEVMSITQQGTKNSQYNTRWIYNNNLQKCKKISKCDQLPNGWKEGRKIKWGSFGKEYNFEYKKQCKNCEINFKTTSQNMRYCSKKCKSDYTKISQTRKDNNTIQILNSIANKYDIVYKTLTKNTQFITDAVNADVSLRKICHYLKCNDSGGNYNTIKNIILN